MTESCPQSGRPDRPGKFDVRVDRVEQLGSNLPDLYLLFMEHVLLISKFFVTASNGFQVFRGLAVGRSFAQTKEAARRNA